MYTRQNRYFLGFLLLLVFPFNSSFACLCVSPELTRKIIEDDCAEYFIGTIVYMQYELTNEKKIQALRKENFSTYHYRIRIDSVLNGNLKQGDFYEATEKNTLPRAGCQSIPPYQVGDQIVTRGNLTFICSDTYLYDDLSQEKKDLLKQISRQPYRTAKKGRCPDLRVREIKP